MFKKIALIACIVAIPTLTVAFAPSKGNKKNYRNMVEIAARKKAQQIKKEIITFFASRVIKYNQSEK